MAMASPPTLSAASGYRWFILGLLTCVQMLSMADRQVLAMLAPRIRDDLGVGNAEMGLLLGTLFGLFYALFSLPLGRLVDQLARPKLLSVCLAGWSLMTLLSGMATQFIHLALARLGLGLGEAAAQPVAVSWLSDLFPAGQRGVIGASMSIGVACGLGAAMWFGSTVADIWDATYTLGTAPLGLRGWQVALIALGLPGLLLAPLIALLPDAVRGGLDCDKPATSSGRLSASMSLAAALPLLSLILLAKQRCAKAVIFAHGLMGISLLVFCLLLHAANAALHPDGYIIFRFLGLAVDANDIQWFVFGLGLHALAAYYHVIRHIDPAAHQALMGKSEIRLLLAIVGIVMIANYGIVSWVSTYVIEAYGLAPAAAGGALALVMVSTGSIGPILSAQIFDRLEARAPGRGLLLPLASFIIAPLLFGMALMASGSGYFFFWFALFSLILTLWLPPLLAHLASAVPADMRGTATSLYILFTTIFGLGLGPYWVGLISELPNLNLRIALASLLPLFPIIAIITFCLMKKVQTT